LSSSVNQSPTWKKINGFVEKIQVIKKEKVWAAKLCHMKVMSLGRYQSLVTNNDQPIIKTNNQEK
jgi:hypothetical protein